MLIKRPIEDVFQAVTALDSAPQWQAELIAVKDVSESPIRAGTTFTAVLRFLGRRIEDVLLVTAFEPNSKLSLETISGPLPSELDFSLEPVREGTKVAYSGAWQLPSGVLTLLTPAKPILDRLDQRQWQANLNRLKELVEAGFEYSV